MTHLDHGSVAACAEALKLRDGEHAIIGCFPIFDTKILLHCCQNIVRSTHQARRGCAHLNVVLAHRVTASGESDDQYDVCLRCERRHNGTTGMLIRKDEQSTHTHTHTPNNIRSVQSTTVPTQPSACTHQKSLAGSGME